MTAQVSIAEACSLVTDGTHYTPVDVGEGYPFLTVKDVSDAGLDFEGCARISAEDFSAADAGNSAPKLGDVLFSKDGTVGKVHVVKTDERFAVLSSLAILRPKVGVVPDYLGHVLRFPMVLDEALKRKTGSAIRRIVLADLKQVRIPLPSTEEQRRIAAILDKADALRTKRRAALAQLDHLAQSMFVEMFGDPEINERRFPVAELQDLCSRVTDGTHQSPKWEQSGIPFLFISNIIDGKVTFETDKFISRETYDELTRRCRIEAGDVLYTTVGSYGNTAVVDGRREFCFQRHIAHIKPNPALLDSVYCAVMLESPGVRRQVDRCARGVAQKTVNLSDLKTLKVLAPPLEAQNEFRRKADAARQLKDAHLRALRHDEALLLSLKYRAFRGDL